MTSNERNTQSPHERWSVDPTLRFSRIHVIESLNTGCAGRSGRRLAEEIESLAIGGPVKVAYHPVDGRDLLRAVLLAIVSEAQAGPFSAEWLFLRILEGYFNEHTTPDQVAIRAERVVAQMVLNRGGRDMEGLHRFGNSPEGPHQAG